MLFKCTPEQLGDFRNAMFAVYRNATGNDFGKDDLVTMKLLQNKISKRISSKDGNLDRILKLQLQWLINNLDEFIDNLSKPNSSSRVVF